MTLALLLKQAGHEDAEILTFHCDFSAAVDSAATAGGAASVGLPPAGLLPFIGEGSAPVQYAHKQSAVVWCLGQPSSGVYEISGPVLTRLLVAAVTFITRCAAAESCSMRRKYNNNRCCLLVLGVF